MTRLFEAKPFIIAEVGSNFHDLRDCLDSISAAKACGADAVKFQLFDDFSLYGFERPSWEAGVRDLLGPDNWTGRPRRSFRLEASWLPQLKEKAAACGIEFVCTAFSEELVDIVDPYVSVHKVASSDNTHIELLRHIKSKGKPILLSCGASNPTEIGWVLRHLDIEKDKIVLLYCNAAYPSYEHNLFSIDGFRFAFNCHVGLSDHSLDVVWAPLSAVDLFGAIVVEKHFRLDRITGTPDAPHSLDQRQFKIMVDSIRRPVQNACERGWGTSEENDFKLRHKRRAVALKDLKPGDRLEYGVNYGYYRVLEPDDRGFSALNGRLGLTVATSVAAGRPISFSDLSHGGSNGDNGST